MGEKDARRDLERWGCLKRSGRRCRGHRERKVQLLLLEWWDYAEEMASENWSRRKTKQDLKIYLVLCQSKLNNAIRIDRCATEEALEEIWAGARGSATDFDRRRRRRGRRRRAIFLDAELQQVEDDRRDGSTPGGFATKMGFFGDGGRG
ncbi:hypothetical protein AAC387_Pa02g1704 [Persea americana]